MGGGEVVVADVDVEIDVDSAANTRAVGELQFGVTLGGAKDLNSSVRWVFAGGE